MPGKSLYRYFSLNLKALLSNSVESSGESGMRTKLLKINIVFR